MEKEKERIERYENLSIKLWRLMVGIGFLLAFSLCISQYYLVPKIGVVPFLTITTVALALLLSLLILSRIYHRKCVKLRKELKSVEIKKSRPKSWEDLFVKKS